LPAMPGRWPTSCAAARLLAAGTCTCAPTAGSAIWSPTRAATGTAPPVAAPPPRSGCRPDAANCFPPATSIWSSPCPPGCARSAAATRGRSTACSSRLRTERSGSSPTTRATSAVDWLCSRCCTPVLAVLHTWTRALVHHPHIHCLAPAGGLGTDGRWRPSNPAFPVPVKALSRLFRGMFLAKLEAALPEVAIPPSVRRKDWVVHCKAAPCGPERVLQYLGRYLQRVAITSARLVGFDQDTVSFRYRSPDSGPWRTMKLPGHEFLRRYLQHVLPRGFHKVRHFGLWHPCHREDLRRVAAQLVLASAQPGLAAAAPAPAATPAARTPPRCPRCGSIRLHCLGIRRPTTRAP